MVNCLINIRVEEHHHSVKDIKKLTLFAEDAEECPFINKIVPTQLADIQPPDSEDVSFL